MWPQGELCLPGSCAQACLPLISVLSPLTSCSSLPLSLSIHLVPFFIAASSSSNLSEAWLSLRLRLLPYIPTPLRGSCYTCGFPYLWRQTPNVFLQLWLWAPHWTSVRKLIFLNRTPSLSPYPKHPFDVTFLLLYHTSLVTQTQKVW